METRTEVRHIVRDPDVLGGKPVIEGHHIAVHHIAWWYSQGITTERLAQEYALTPAEVHAALVYYYDHKDEIAAQQSAIADAHRQAEQIASAAGVSLGSPISIDSSGCGAAQQPSVAAAGQAGSAKAPTTTPVQPGQAEVSAEVAVVYAIR